MWFEDGHGLKDCKLNAFNDQVYFQSPLTTIFYLDQRNSHWAFILNY